MEAEAVTRINHHRYSGRRPARMLVRPGYLGKGGPAVRMLTVTEGQPGAAL